MGLTSELEELARRLQAKSGLKPLDALHLASEFISGADYFCTSDDKFLKKAKKLEGLGGVEVVSPVELVMESDI